MNNLSFEEFQKIQEQNEEIIKVFVQTKKHKGDEAYELEIARGRIGELFDTVEGGKYLPVPTADHVIFIAPSEVAQITIPKLTIEE